MKRKNVVLSIFLLSLIPLCSQESDKRDVKDRKFLAHGPRMGLTGLYNSNTGEWGIKESESIILNKDIPAVISQFGYHMDLSLYVTNKMNPLVQFDGLVGGVEHGFFLPSFSMVIGFRFFDILELGVGPNVSLSGAGLVFAAGGNFQVDNVFFPINLAVVHSNGNYRFSLLTGFNAP